MRTWFIAAFLAIALAAPALSAEPQKPETAEDKISAFQQVGEMTATDIKVPTVLETPLTYSPFNSQQVAVFDTEKNVFVPNYIFTRQHEKPLVFSAVSNKSSGADSALTDEDPETYIDFDLPEGKAGEATIELTTQTPVTADGLFVSLASHVAMPVKVEIRAMVDGKSKILLREGEPACSTCITFPSTTSSDWTIRMTYGQPLRITGIAFNALGHAETPDYRLRFLAQPGRHYKIYRFPDRSVGIPTGETPNLTDDKDVRQVAALSNAPNPTYREADVDGDGIPDVRDNCVYVKNADQADIDGNLRGDACDDWDRDGVLNTADNCPSDTNADQRDTDHDGKGDVCDAEESRITEKYTWLPWLVIIGAAVLIGFFFVRVSKTAPKGPDKGGTA